MKKILFSLCVFSLLLISCDDEEAVNPDGFKEFTVNVNGSWQLNNVTQNNVDITNRFDFQSTNLVLNYSDDGSPSSFELTRSNGTPSPLLMSSGSWTFDDLTYPTEVTFTGTGNTTIKLTGLPLQTGGNDMRFEVNHGCADNTYVYSFKKN